MSLALLAGEVAAQPAPPAVSGNPAATTHSTGTGWLGRTLGLNDDWGINLGGLWLADTNVVVAGGAKPGGWTSNSALFIGELQYSVNSGAASENSMVRPGEQGLPGVYKIGLWYNTGSFADQRYDNTGLSLADPNSSGVAQQHRGNYSIYAVADQTIWQPDPEDARALNAFARIMGSPGDRNLVSWSANTGLVLKKPFPGRDNDSLGIGLSYIRIGSHAVGYDQDSGNAVRSSETALELTYQYQVTPWWLIQPDFQYTLHPGAGQNPNNPLQSLRNTFVVGVRTTITF